MPIEKLEKHLPHHRNELREMQSTIERGVTFTKHRKDIQKIIHFCDGETEPGKNEISEADIPTIYDPNDDSLAPRLLDLQAIHNSLYGPDELDEDSLEALADITMTTATLANNVDERLSTKLHTAAEEFIQETQKPAKKLLATTHEVIKTLVNKFRVINDKKPLAA